MRKESSYNNVLDYKRPIVMRSSIRIANNEATPAEIFNQFFHTDNCVRWFSMRPVVGIRFPGSTFLPDDVATLYFRCPYFSYQLQCEKAEPNRFLSGTLSGPVNGFLHMEVLEGRDETELVYTLSIQGKNRWIHWYYVLTCFLPHGPYMKWRLAVLRKQARANFKTGVSMSG